MKVSIHNQYSDLWLKTGRYFGIGVDWDEKPNEKIESDNTMSVDLMPLLATFEGVLTYDLKKIGVGSTYIRLFVGWKSEGYKKFHVVAHLVEYDDWYNWGQNELEEYCRRYASRLYTYTGPIENTWSMPDGTALMIELELNFTQRDGVLNITVSEGIGNEHTKKLEWIKLKR
jgi:hypothetical protein